MAAMWVFCLCFVACGVTPGNAASLKRHKREILTSGWLASANYPDSYPNDATQDFTIQTDPNRPCRVTIRYVADIEWASGCVYDRLVLNVGKPDQEVVCGNTNDQVVTYTTTVDDGSGVDISFSSDSTQGAKGYRLEYTVEPIEPAINLYSSNQYGTVAPQGRAINEGRQSTGNYASEQWGNSGTFTSPNYNTGSYPGDYDGSYLAHLDTSGSQTVRVNYNYDIEMQENCLFDYLEYVNTGQRVCGESLGTVDIPVDGDSFEVRFHSDNNDNRRGFTLDYEVVPQFQSRSLSLDSGSTNSTDGGLPVTEGDIVTEGTDAVFTTDSDAVAVEESIFVTTAPQSNNTDVPATSDDQICDLCEWTQYGDYDYSYNRRMMTFDDAAATCARCSGQMVTAKDQEQFDLTQRIFLELSGSDNVPHWLAATDRDTEGDWTWQDGTAVSYTNWKRREPDNIDEAYTNSDCLVVNNKGQWRDQECNHPRKSLCRRPLGLNVPCIAAPDYPDYVTEGEAVAVPDVVDVETTMETTPLPEELPMTTVPEELPMTTVPEELPMTTVPEELPMTTVAEELPVTTAPLPVNQIEEISVFVPVAEACCSLAEWTVYGDSEYSYNKRGLTFDQAVSACTNCGGQLITAINDDEFAFTQRIFAELSGADDIAHWLAATDRGTEGDWTWQDGTVVSYTNWKRREPDNRDENGEDADCLVVNNKGLWRDQQCNHTRRSMCKRPQGTVIEPLAMCVETEETDSTPLPAMTEGTQLPAVSSERLVELVFTETPSVGLTEAPEAEVSGEPVSDEIPPVNQIDGISVFLPSEEQCCSLAEWTMYGDNEYSYNKRGLAFDQAVSACTNCGGQLITAINDDEFALTQRIFAELSGSDDVPHWLAATDRGTEGDWTWLDGTVVSYTSWKRREPDNKDENGNNADCLVVNNKGQWRDQKCNHTRKSMCMRPPGTVVEPLSMCVETELTESSPAPAPVVSSESQVSPQPDSGEQLPPVNQIDGISVYVPTDLECCSLREWREYGDYEYSYNNHMLAFDQAVTACTNCGGQLTTAINDDEFALTQRIFVDLSGSDNVPHWLAATDRDTEGDWTWLDGTAVSYTNWKRREPDNKDENGNNADCLVVNNKGQWRDQKCNHTRKSLCRRPIGTEVSPLDMCLDTENAESSLPSTSAATTSSPSQDMSTVGSGSNTQEPQSPLYSLPTEEPTYLSSEGPYASPTFVYESTYEPTSTYVPSQSSSYESASYVYESTYEPTSYVYESTSFPSQSPSYESTSYVYESTYEPTSYVYESTYFPSQSPSYEPTSYVYESTYFSSESPSYEPTSYVYESTYEPTSYAYESSYPPSERPYYSPSYEPTLSPDEISTYSPTPTPDYYPTETPAYYYTEGNYYSPSNEPSNYPSAPTIRSSSEGPEYYTSVEYPSSGSAGAATSQYGTGSTMSDVITGLSTPSGQESSDGRSVRGSTGYITSPNYPEFYPSNQDYEVTVTLDQAGPQTVELTLDDFDVEWNSICAYDYVLINGDESNKLCGVKNGQKISVDVPGDTFTVTLRSDGSVQTKGFNISYRVEQESTPGVSVDYTNTFTEYTTSGQRDYITTTQPPTPDFTNTVSQATDFVTDTVTTTYTPDVSSAQPGNNVRGNSGYITSRNYPESYPSNEDYEVTVTLDQAGPQTVELTLDDFDVEWNSFCAYDYVIINSDETNKLCGVKNGEKISVEVPDDTFTVTLHSDGSVQRKGFNISYTVEQEYTTIPTVDYQTSSIDIGSIDARGYTYSSTNYGNSPSYTSDYGYSDVYTSYDYPSYATDYGYSDLYTGYGYPSYTSDYGYSDAFTSYGDYPSYSSDYGYSDSMYTGYGYPSYTSDYGYSDAFTSYAYPSYATDYGYSDWYTRYGDYPSYATDDVYTNGYTDSWTSASSTSDYGYTDTTNYGYTDTSDYGYTDGYTDHPFNTGDYGYYDDDGNWYPNDGAAPVPDKSTPGVSVDYTTTFTEYTTSGQRDYVTTTQPPTPDFTNTVSQATDFVTVEVPDDTFTVTLHSDGSVQRKGFNISYTVEQEYTTIPTVDYQTSSIDIGSIDARGYTYSSTNYGNSPSYTSDYGYSDVYTSYDYPSYATDYGYSDLYTGYGYPSYSSDYGYSDAFTSYGGYPSYSSDYGYSDLYTGYGYPSYTSDYGYSDAFTSYAYPSYATDYGYSDWYTRYGDYPSYATDDVYTNGYTDSWTSASSTSDYGYTDTTNYGYTDTSDYGYTDGYTDHPFNTGDYGYYDDDGNWYPNDGAAPVPDNTDFGSGSGSRRCPRREYHINSNSGHLKSPNYPGTYSNNEDFDFTVTLDQPGPQTVYLNFDDFDVEWNSDCAYDYVIINGDVSNKLCGLKAGESMEVEVPDDTFTLTFHSDESLEKRGFDIYYSSSQEPTEEESNEDGRQGESEGDMLEELWGQIHELNNGIDDTLDSWDTFQQVLPFQWSSEQDTPLGDRIPDIPTRAPPAEATPFNIPGSNIPSDVPPVESRPLEIPESDQQDLVEEPAQWFDWLN
ncbi:uncharacterized protein [Littorina saxatilis]|uniref:uncharacterized protein isoform X2 n=1 Tax=Littorina saxatilis TaxID=31220 RepID=UPI0038B57D2B